MAARRATTIARIPLVRRVGNVFADLRIPNPEEALIKARIASALADVIRAMGLTQAGAAEMLGIDQPKVSMLLRGRLKDFSVDRLIRFLILLRQDIHITVTPRRKKHADQVTVQVA